MLRRRFERKYQIAALLAAVFLIALVSWLGHDPKSTPVSIPSAVPSQSSSPDGGVGLSSGVPTPAKSSSATDLPSLLNQEIPNFAITADPGGLPLHSIQMKVSSDSVIAAFGYLVANGKPPRYAAYFLKSPVNVVTSGRSNGYVAFVVAEASSAASYITCTLTVDGVVKSQHTARGPYESAACIG